MPLLHRAKTKEKAMFVLETLTPEQWLRVDYDMLEERLHCLQWKYAELCDDNNDLEREKAEAEHLCKVQGQELATLKSKKMEDVAYDRFLNRQGLEIDRPVGQMLGFKIFTDISLPDDVILIKNCGKVTMLQDFFNKQGHL
jgi:hypothetical protein